MECAASLDVMRLRKLINDCALRTWHPATRAVVAMLTKIMEEA